MIMGNGVLHMRNFLAVTRLESWNLFQSHNAESGFYIFALEQVALSNQHDLETIDLINVYF